MATCEVVECRVSVNKEGHTLCYEHWEAKRDGHLSRCVVCNRWKETDKPRCYPCYTAGKTEAGADEGLLSATELGESFGMSAQAMNLALAELGWIKREATKGWTATAQGRRAGAVEREARQSGIPYVVWSPKVQSNRALLAAVRADDATSTSSEEDLRAILKQMATPAGPAPAAPQNFRDVHDTPYRAQDGHRVRSRAELVIDNWLYTHQIVHAYERKVPVDEDLVCDFWIPGGRVYIEYWGMDQDEVYAARRREKQAIYSKYDLALIELGDSELKSLDDHLPRLLRKFGVAVD